MIKVKTSRLLIAGCALFLIPVLIQARSPKFSKDLDADGGRSTVDVVVQFSRPLQPKFHERIGARGGHLNVELPIIQGAAYTIPSESLEELAADPDVAYVSPDRHVTALLDST